MLDRANTQSSGSAHSATGHRFGTRRLRELLAARGDAGLWLAEDDDGGETLLRLYPGLLTLEELHKLELAAAQLVYVVDSRLVPVQEIALDVWPRLSFACAGAESLSRTIAREPMAPEAAVAMCADVAGALAALGRSGVPAVDVSPADIVLVGGRGRLLADVGLPGGRVAHTCVDLDHVAPERAAAIAGRRQGAELARGEAYPTASSMTYALASIVSAAVHGPQAPAEMVLPARLEQVLRRGLADVPAERYGSPAALVEALYDALGVDLRHSDGASARRATRGRGARRPVTRERARPGRRRVGIVIAAAALLVAAAIGTLAGSATTAPDPPAAVTLAGAGLSVEAPRGWLRGGAGDGPSAIGKPVIVARPSARSSAAALVITREAAPLLAELADAVPEAVRLGDHDAWRYRDFAVDDESVADVYVLEDGDGPIVAACLGPSAARSAVRERCSAALTTLRLDAGQSVALGGDPAARRNLARVVEDLDRARERERRALAAAVTGRRQAAAADRLAAAYARAAGSAGRARTVGAPGELPRLVDRLEQTGRAYAALARAARATRRPAYVQARERIDAHERALREELAAFASVRSGS